MGNIECLVLAAPPWPPKMGKCVFLQKVAPNFFSFLTCRSKNLKFLLSKQHSILKFFQIFQTKNWKNLRIEHCLESKNFKFFDLQVRSEKKNWGLLSEKNAFLQNFQCSRAHYIGFSSGAQYIHLGAPFVMVGKNIETYAKKLQNIFLLFCEGSL